MFVEIGGEAMRVGVAATQEAILEPQRVDRADLLGRLVASPECREHHFLVRNGDVAATEAIAGK
jgi:hypothetical protein